MKLSSNYFINKPNNLITDNATSGILKTTDALNYHSSLFCYKPTPLIELNGLANQLGLGNIFLKDESHRFGLNAFKGLGASYAMHKIIQQSSRIHTFCTATDGNHGRAVAWSAKLNGKFSVIIVPKDTVSHRIELIKNEGARVIKIDGNYDEACKYAAELSKQEGWQLVQDTAWKDYTEIPAMIMAGYLSLFKELENSLHLLPKPNIDLVLLQAGVGSFAASGIWYYLNRYGIKRPKIVLIEPLEADGILESFKQGGLHTTTGKQQTIMAGLNCGIPSMSAWEILQNGMDAVLRISDKFAEQAMRLLYHPNSPDQKIISGESGAAGLAGLLAMLNEPEFLPLKNNLDINANTSILVINTEGATDPKNFDRIVHTN